MSADKNQLISIQYLRALAALMVVLHHARNPQDWLFNPIANYDAFAWGVDIFFVISGFIMYTAARHESYIDFLGRRIVRVVPMYWFSTLALLAINTKGYFWRLNSDDLSHLIQSLLFIPHYSPSYPNQIWPYLIPGWTLNYEMLFYLIFSFGLMVQRLLAVSTLAILGLFFIGLAIELQSPIARAYTNPILLEFLLGILSARAYLSGSLRKSMSISAPLGLLGLFLLPFVSDKGLIQLGRVVCSTMVIIGTVSLGQSVPRNKLLNLLGDASYSIYLTHTFLVIRWSSGFWQRVPVLGWLQFTGWIILTLALSSAVGIIVYIYIERPILKWLRSKWKAIAFKKLSACRCTNHTRRDFT